MAFGCTLTVDTGKIPSSQSDFIWFFTEQNFIDANNEAAIDGTANSILNGGLNLRCYTDDTKTTQLAIQVVKFVTGGTPSVEVWGISSSLDVGDTVYIEADDTATAQPAVTDTFGRNAVWAFYDGVWHLGESSGDFIDSTGNGWDITPSSETGITRSATGKTGNCIDLDATQIGATQLEVATGSDATWNDAHTKTIMQAWVSRDSDESGPNVILETGGINNGEAIYYRNGPNTLHFGTSQNGNNLELDSTTTMGEFSSFFMVHGVYDAGSQSLYTNGTLEDTGTNGTQIPAASSESSLGCEGASMTGAADPGNPWSGRLNEIRRARDSRSSDYIAAEYNNQNDSGAFWTTSAWADAGGSGVSITSLLNLNYMVEYSMKQNVAGQSIGAQMVTISDGSPFTGTVSADVTIDNGTKTAGSGTVTHEGDGYHSYAPTQAETNGNHIAVTFSGTGALSQTIQVYTTFPQTVDNDTAIQALNDISPAQVNAECDTALSDYDGPTNTEMNARTIISASYALEASIGSLNDFNPASDTVANVTLVATTTTNTDMRGTDSALLASGYTVAPTTAQIWAESTRVLTAGDNIVLSKGVGLTGLNDIAATAIVTGGAITTVSGDASVDINKINGVTIVGDGSGTPFDV